MRNCWCGNIELFSFSPEYSECKVCGTLVLQNELSADHLVVKDDEIDFYGKQYWLGHQNKDFGYPDIYDRARNDLTERNLHWLKSLIKYRLPPANVLELGCSHGSFVALLQQTGYQASGVEMSPWVVSFGIETFQIPMHLGPVENISIPPGSLDVIALMDVLEHLPDPLSTLHHCSNLLKPGGSLLIQTPNFEEGMSYPLLKEVKHPFLDQLKVDEHLYLFSQSSMMECLKQVGFNHIYFEPAIFAVYDMFLVASKVPLEANNPDQIEASLLAHPQSRMTLALLDLRERELALAKALQDSEQDRAARLEQIITLTQQSKEAEVDRQLHTAQIEALTQQVEILNQKLNEKNIMYWLKKLKKLFT